MPFSCWAVIISECLSAAERCLSSAKGRGDLWAKTSSLVPPFVVMLGSNCVACKGQTNSDLDATAAAGFSSSREPNGNSGLSPGPWIPPLSACISTVKTWSLGESKAWRASAAFDLSAMETPKSFSASVEDDDAWVETEKPEVVVVPDLRMPEGLLLLPGEAEDAAAFRLLLRRCLLFFDFPTVFDPSSSPPSPGLSTARSSNETDLL